MSFHKLKLISFPFISKGTRYFFSNKMWCDDIRTQHTDFTNFHLQFIEALDSYN